MPPQKKLTGNHWLPFYIFNVQDGNLIFSFYRYHSGRRIVDDANDGIGINFGELKNNVKRSGGNFLNKIKLFRNKSRVNTANMSNYGKLLIRRICILNFMKMFYIVLFKFREKDARVCC